jgi:hypothetical protein
MQRYTIKFVIDKVTEQEKTVEALDKTKAYLEFVFKHPTHYEITEITEVPSEAMYCVSCGAELPTESGTHICKECVAK